MSTAEQNAASAIPQESLPTDVANPMPSKQDEKLEERVIDKPIEMADAESAAAGKKRDRDGEEKGTGLDLQKQLGEQGEGNKEEEEKDNDSDKKVDLEKKDELIGQDKLEQPVSKKPKLDEEAADAAANKALEAPVEEVRQEQVASNE
jgi:hypothetical protein